MANIVGCACDGTTKNTGFLGQQIFGVKQSIYIVPVLADDGTRNGLDLTAPDLAAEILGKVNHPDPSKRWYPLHKIEEYAPADEDTQFATTSGGVESKLRNGIKKDTWQLWDESAQLYAKIEDFCFDFGVIEVDECANLRGYKESATATMLYPRLVNNRSWDANSRDKQNDTPSHIMVQYQFERGDTHSKLWLVPGKVFGANNPLQLKGLVDVIVTATPLTATTIQLDVKGTFGDALNLIPIQGLVAANTTVLNVTAGAPATVDTLVADAVVKGRYVLTLDTAPTTGDVLNISVFKAATSALTQGFEGAAKGVVSL